MAPFAVLCFAVAFLVPAQAALVTYDLTVTYGLWSPDCVEVELYLMNGQYPGPTLVATEGDIMIVTVHNRLSTESLSFHWHGIRQWYNNLNDGVSFVTQCPLGPRQTYNYTVVLDKSGTYAYHGHLSMHKSGGMYGQLIVKEKPKALAHEKKAHKKHKGFHVKGSPFPYKYDKEYALILNDWYHRTVQEQLAGLDAPAPTFQFVGPPQSLIFNGKGLYDCNKIPSGYDPIVGDVKYCNATSPQCGYEVLYVRPGKRYRLRITSLTSLLSLNMAIQGHTMTLVHADGYLLKPFRIGAEGLDIHSGMTRDVIFKADQPMGNYWIRTAVFGQPPPYSTVQGLAIIRYFGAPRVPPSGSPPPYTQDPLNPAAAFAQALKYKGLTVSEGGDVPQVPTKVTTQKMHLVGANQIAEGFISEAVNSVALQFPSTPYALGLAKGLKFLYPPPSNTFVPWNYSGPSPYPAVFASNYYQLKYNKYVDVVVQATGNLFPGSEFHPWHMHGHQFWVLGTGMGTWDPKTSPKEYNFVDPPYMNTWAPIPFGWIALRFKADNPGAWLFHCHLETHHYLGMKIVFVDGHVLPLPHKINKCGVLY